MPKKRSFSPRGVGLLTNAEKEQRNKNGGARKTRRSKTMKRRTTRRRSSRK